MTPAKHTPAAIRLAELVLDMGMVTEKGLRARELAREVLSAAEASTDPQHPCRAGCAVSGIQASVHRQLIEGDHLGALGPSPKVRFVMTGFPPKGGC